MDQTQSSEGCEDWEEIVYLLSDLIVSEILAFVYR